MFSFKNTEKLLLYRQIVIVGMFSQQFPDCKLYYYPFSLPDRDYFVGDVSKFLDLKKYILIFQIVLLSLSPYL